LTHYQTTLRHEYRTRAEGERVASRKQGSGAALDSMTQDAGDLTSTLIDGTDSFSEDTKVAIEQKHRIAQL